MSSLSIDKSQIFEESFPKPLVSDSWIVQWFDMHNRIWWEILNTDKIPNGLVDVNGVNKLGKNGQPIVTNVDKWARWILQNSHHFKYSTQLWDSIRPGEC